MVPAAPGTWPGRCAARYGLSVLLVALLGGTAQAAGSVSLPGTWYVLVHYKDDAASNPDEERWEDKVWVFEDQGRRLGWTEYPIVVFDDETGRFERRSTGQYARILHSWEPDAGQRADIADGLRVNTRGSKSKTLRGSDAQGWSSGRRQSAASASVITYEEVWSIEDLASLPVFTRRDYMGGGRTDSIEGAIRYTTTEVREGGDLLVGTFERDGSRHGTFRMMRSGAVGSLEERSQSEIRRRVTADAGSGGVPVFGEAGAVHAPDVRYAWPYDASVPRPLIHGPGSGSTSGRRAARFTLPDELAQALVFELPVGSPVLAARSGTVAQVQDGIEVSSPAQSNAVFIAHDDGTWAVYAGLRQGLAVREGQRVETGDRLGDAGAWSVERRAGVIFAVQRLDANRKVESLPVRFDDGTPEGVAPVVGGFYGRK